MYSYSLTQWILFFFCYCFFGWIWECFYVSVKHAWKEKHWKFINRGFLHGPVIPIYGFAAITILLSTIRLRDYTLAVYAAGALTATLFELFTGTVMERIFKVKYWDYSNMPLNYNGHICFFVSLFWGFFSVLLVKVIHVPVEGVIMGFPEFVAEMIAFSLMAVFIHDVTASVNEAMDLRDVLESLTDHHETVKRLERRFEALAAFSPIPDIENLRDKKLSAKKHLIHKVEKLRWMKEEHLNRIRDHLQLPDFDHLSDQKEILEKLEIHRKRIVTKSNHQFLRALRQLKRNPGARSEKYQEALEMLKELFR